MIEALLKRENICIGHNTIHRILVKHGLNNPLENPRKTRDKTRFERLHSNSLWQTDFKLTEYDTWMITFLMTPRIVAQGKKEAQKILDGLSTRNRITDSVYNNGAFFDCRMSSPKTSNLKL